MQNSEDEGTASASLAVESESNDELSDSEQNVSDREETEPTTENDTDEVILSVYWRSGKLGAAVYSLQNPVVYVLNDVVDDFLMGLKILRGLLMETQPTQVITCKSMPQKFIFILNHILGGHPFQNDYSEKEQSKQFKLVGNLHIMPDAEFRHQNSLRQVLNMRLPGESNDCEEEMHKQFIRSIIDTKKECMVNALARLLKYLNTNLMCLSHVQNPVLTLRALSLEDHVWVNSEIFENLGIFSQTPHPSLYKWSHGASKEGLSIFGIFNRCQSKLGSKFMRAALMQPVSNQDILIQRHEVVSFCIDTKNDDVVRRMRSCIGKVQNVMGMLPRLFAAQASIAQWKSLKQTNHNILLLREICVQFSGSVSLFKKAHSIISEDLYRIDYLMEQVIDFQTSERMKRFVVLSGVDEELDEKKRIHAQLPTIMSKVAALELPDLPPYIEACSTHYIPEIGFLICICMWKDDLTEEEMLLPGFQFKFIANKSIYFKSPRCQELDHSIGDISLNIRALELKIMLRLIQYIQKFINTLVDSLSLVGELDCLIAFADVAKEFGYVKPILSSRREILIWEGRHPLQEHCVSNFVTNDTFSNEEHGFSKLLTGPNASGKSIYLKQVAMIAFLAHTGSFVPAKRAIVGVLDQIHTIIQTRECAASQLSAFMIDLRQINAALTMSTKSSLVVIDEFGKGTSEEDGPPLFAAFIKKFLELGPSKCPHLFISTHFHMLINLLKNYAISTYILDHMVSDAELLYLFQLKEGQAERSLAFDLARASDFPETITKRASEILTSLEGNRLSRPTHNHKLFSKKNEDLMLWFSSESFDMEKVKEFKEKEPFNGK